MTIVELVQASGGLSPRVTPLTITLATLLALLGPAAAAGAGINAFRQRKWLRYRNFSVASCIGSLSGILVIAYVLCLGSAATLAERATRLMLAIAVGAFQCLTLSMSVLSAVLGAWFIVGWRTDEVRHEGAQVGHPMLAVFAVILLALLTVAVISVEIAALKRF